MQNMNYYYRLFIDREDRPKSLGVPLAFADWDWGPDRDIKTLKEEEGGRQKFEFRRRHCH